MYHSVSPLQRTKTQVTHEHATQQPEDANLENQEAKAPEAAEQAAETAPEAAPETPAEPVAEAAPAAEAAPEPTPTEPVSLQSPREFDWDTFESEQDDYLLMNASVWKTCTNQA